MTNARLFACCFSSIASSFVIRHSSSPMRDIVYFDLETQRTANDAGGWDKKRDMGMSIGVTYSTLTGLYHI